MNATEIFAMVAAKTPTESTEVASDLELDVRLSKESYEKLDGTMSGAQYRGRNSRKGEARARVWIGGTSDQHAGEILVVRPDDITHAEPATGFGGVKLARYEFRKTASDNSLIVLWVPAEDYDFSSLKVTVAA